MDALAPKKTETRASQAEAILGEVSVKLLSSSEWREALDLIAYHCARRFGASKASINLLENGRLRTCAKYVEPGGYFAFLGAKKMGAKPLPPDQHPHMYEVVRSGSPQVVQSRTIHDLKERVEGRPVPERPDVFYIFEPLRVSDEILGVAAINLTREQMERITPRDRNLVQQLLNLAAIALNNIRLIKDLRTAKARLEDMCRQHERVLDAMAQAGEEAERRPLGLPWLEEAPWGTHIVALYESPERLLDILASYFAEGLRGNELCLWVLSSIGRDDALAALGGLVPDLEERLRRGQLVMAESRQWYLGGGEFDGSRILKAWRERVEEAARNGYEGTRVSGDTSFLGRDKFAAFMDYEAALHHEVGRLRAIVLCTYDLSQWQAPELVDVILRHEYALMESGGTWQLTESAEKGRADRRLQQVLNYQTAVLSSLEEAVLSLDLEGRIIYANPAACRLFGYGQEELRQKRVCDLRVLGPGCRPGDSRCLLRQLEKPAAGCEVEFANRGGQAFSARQTLTALHDHGGKLIGAVLAIQDVSTVERLEGQAAYLAEEVQDLSGRHGLVAISEGMRNVMKQVSLVAPTDSSVLILGETGTGKELIARVIHELSPRKDKPLVKVHCAALSPGLIESEFFGHEKGAFTGAISRKMGRFELADRGTIFLDEVGDIPLETQVKLLRVIQEREFERVGGTRPIRVDVRIIAATNADMEAAVKSGAFRRDLYYRLSVFPIHLPPLRDRLRAIPVLAANFAHDCAKGLGRTFEGISPEGLRRLKAYEWPGNVRELRNVIERAVITSPGPVISVGGLGFGPHRGGGAAAADEPLALEEAERRHILRVLEQTSWRIEGRGGAADLLRINASTLRSRMKKLHIAKKPS